MSHTVRHVPTGYHRKPRGAKAAKIRGDRPRAIPPTSWDDLPIGHEAWTAHTVSAALAAKGVHAPEIARRITARFPISHKNAIGMARSSVHRQYLRDTYALNRARSRAKTVYFETLTEHIRTKFAAVKWAGTRQPRIAQHVLAGDHPFIDEPRGPYTRAQGDDILRRMGRHANLTLEEAGHLLNLSHRSIPMSSRNANCAFAGVKGISDAVRQAIPIWVTNDLIDRLFVEYRKISKDVSIGTFGVRVAQADAWKRYRRGNDPKGDGFFRTYYCQAFGSGPTAKGLVNLEVLTNREDTQIKYVMFKVNGQTVYGGACNVPSTFFPKLGYTPTLTDTFSQPKAGVPATAAFIPFTEKQLQKLATQYEFGGMGAIDRMFDERV